MDSLFTQVDVCAENARVLFEQARAGMDPRLAMELSRALEQWKEACKKAKSSHFAEQTRWANYPSTPPPLT